MGGSLSQPDRVEAVSRWVLLLRADSVASLVVKAMVTLVKGVGALERFVSWATAARCQFPLRSSKNDVAWPGGGQAWKGSPALSVEQVVRLENAVFDVAVCCVCLGWAR
eukprot:739062-Amphidinium_carterae.1